MDPDNRRCRPFAWTATVDPLFENLQATRGHV
jgi:hypothetical protein